MHFYKLFELEMCFGSVCKQPPYNDKNLFFVYSLNVFPFLKSTRLTVWCHTDRGPSHDCWLTVAFQHRLHYVLPQTRPVWAVISCVTAGADVDKNDS